MSWQYDKSGVTDNNKILKQNNLENYQNEVVLKDHLGREGNCISKTVYDKFEEESFVPVPEDTSNSIYNQLDMLNNAINEKINLGQSYDEETKGYLQQRAVLEDALARQEAKDNEIKQYIGAKYDYK